jgi:hypothetical protein
MPAKKASKHNTRNKVSKKYVKKSNFRKTKRNVKRRTFKKRTIKGGDDNDKRKGFIKQMFSYDISKLIPKLTDTKFTRSNVVTTKYFIIRLVKNAKNCYSKENLKGETTPECIQLERDKDTIKEAQGNIYLNMFKRFRVRHNISPFNNLRFLSFMLRILIIYLRRKERNNEPSEDGYFMTFCYALITQLFFAKIDISEYNNNQVVIEAKKAQSDPNVQEQLQKAAEQDTGTTINNSQNDTPPITNGGNNEYIDVKNMPEKQKTYVEYIKKIDEEIKDDYKLFINYIIKHKVASLNLEDEGEDEDDEAKITTLNTQIGTLDRTITKKKKEKRTLNDSLIELKNTKGDLNHAIGRLTRLNKQKNPSENEIDRLNKEITNLQNKIDKLEIEKNPSENEIEIVRLNKEIANLNLNRENAISERRGLYHKITLHKVANLKQTDFLSYEEFGYLDKYWKLNHPYDSYVLTYVDIDNIVIFGSFCFTSSFSFAVASGVTGNPILGFYSAGTLILFIFLCLLGKQIRSNKKLDEYTREDYNIIKEFKKKALEQLKPQAAPESAPPASASASAPPASAPPASASASASSASSASASAAPPLLI